MLPSKVMAKDLSFEVDIFDKKALRQKLPELQRTLEQKREELAELEARYQQIRKWAGYPTKKVPSPDGDKPSSAIDEVVEVVNRAGRPMRAREVVVEMGPDAERATVAWALWSAEGAGRLQRVKKGLYAPLDYESPQRPLGVNGSGGETD